MPEYPSSDDPDTTRRIALNESQQRHVAASLARVDQMLQTVERIARAEPGPFAVERSDLTPDECQSLRAFVHHTRAHLLATMDRLSIPRPAPTVSARWSVETSLGFANIALTDLRTTLSGYGPLNTEAAENVEALVAELRETLGRGIALVSGSDATDGEGGVRRRASS